MEKQRPSFLDFIPASWQDKLAIVAAILVFFLPDKWIVPKVHRSKGTRK